MTLRDKMKEKMLAYAKKSKGGKAPKGKKC